MPDNNSQLFAGPAWAAAAALLWAARLPLSRILWMTKRPRPRLPLWDSPAAYGLVSRLLHWGVAGLIGWQLLGMALRLWLGRHPLVSVFVGLHQPLGTLLFVLIVLRLGWMVLNRRNRPGHGAGWLGLATRIGHGALYGLMLVVPLAALLRAYGSGRGFAPWGIPLFPPREPIDALVALGDALHGELAWGLAALVLGHAGMALLHGLLWRDGTLRRMAGRP